MAQEILESQNCKCAICNKTIGFLKGQKSLGRGNYERGDAHIDHDHNTKKFEEFCAHHRLAKAIGDCSWSNFVDMLEYKADWYGRKLVKVNPYNTSKTCSECGTVNQNITLGDRVWTCSCGIKHDRDTNAAINILTTGIADKALTSIKSALIGSLLL